MNMGNAFAKMMGSKPKEVTPMKVLPEKVAGKANEAKKG